MEFSNIEETKDISSQSQMDNNGFYYTEAEFIEEDDEEEIIECDFKTIKKPSNETFLQTTKQPLSVNRQQPQTASKIVVKEIVSYQRFGRSNRRNNQLQSLFKCHLCGFSCSFKNTLLEHFDKIHPTN